MKKSMSAEQRLQNLYQKYKENIEVQPWYESVIVLVLQIEKELRWLRKKSSSGKVKDEEHFPVQEQRELMYHHVKASITPRQLLNKAKAKLSLILEETHSSAELIERLAIAKKIGQVEVSNEIIFNEGATTFPKFISVFDVLRKRWIYADEIYANIGVNVKTHKINKSYIYIYLPKVETSLLISDDILSSIYVCDFHLWKLEEWWIYSEQEMLEKGVTKIEGWGDADWTEPLDKFLAQRRMKYKVDVLWYAKILHEVQNEYPRARDFIEESGNKLKKKYFGGQTCSTIYKMLSWTNKVDEHDRLEPVLFSITTKIHKLRLAYLLFWGIWLLEEIKRIESLPKCRKDWFVLVNKSFYSTKNRIAKKLGVDKDTVMRAVKNKSIQDISWLDPTGRETKLYPFSQIKKELKKKIELPKCEKDGTYTNSTWVQYATVNYIFEYLKERWLKMTYAFIEKKIESIEKVEGIAGRDSWWHDTILYSMPEKGEQIYQEIVRATLPKCDIATWLVNIEGVDYGPLRRITEILSIWGHHTLKNWVLPKNTDVASVKGYDSTWRETSLYPVVTIAKIMWKEYSGKTEDEKLLDVWSEEE